MDADPSASERRWWRLGLLALAALGWLLRASPFFRRDGVLGWPLDYDEGVYTAASALLWRGVLPYRDFVFVHPPGALVALGAVTAWPLSPSTMLAAARVAMSLVGAMNIVLVGAVARRHAGVVGGTLAAALYAAWPEAVVAERGVFLEPLLTAVALGLAWAWCGPHARPRLAGTLAALALGLKTWGGVWLVGGLLGSTRRLDFRRFALAAFLTTLAWVVPCMLLAPAGFLTEVVWLQVMRPPDGDTLFGVRLYEMFLARTPVPALVVALTAAQAWPRRHEPIVRLVSAALLALVGSFFVSPVYWNQYNAHLAAPMALAAGLGAGWWWVARPPQWARFTWVAAAVAVALALPGLKPTLSRRRERAADQPVRAAVTRAQPAQPACAFEVFDLLLADRLPAPVGGAPALVDSYGQMLLGAAQEGTAFESADEAFRAEGAQLVVRQQLAHCEVVVVGWRGRWQLNPASRAWLAERFEEVGQGVFVRRPRP